MPHLGRIESVLFWVNSKHCRIVTLGSLVQPKIRIWMLQTQYHIWRSLLFCSSLRCHLQPRGAAYFKRSSVKHTHSASLLRLWHMPWEKMKIWKIEGEPSGRVKNIGGSRCKYISLMVTRLQEHNAPSTTSMAQMKKQGFSRSKARINLKMASGFTTILQITGCLMFYTRHQSAANDQEALQRTAKCLTKRRQLQWQQHNKCKHNFSKRYGFILTGYTSSLKSSRSKYNL